VFAVWITGLPASGKSTITRALVAELALRNLRAAVLESDELRRVFTPRPTYSDEERDTFYRSIAFVGKLLVEHGVPVIFDATANRRRYRDDARSTIPRFLEVFVDCPVEVCAERDPKGLYRRAREGATSSLPGAGADYEPPLRPDVVTVRGDRADPGATARGIVAALVEKGWVR
jgi:adenylylsulfate kinase